LALFDDPNLNRIPFFMKFRKRKQTFINIPKNISPFNSKSPKARSPISMSPLGNSQPFEMKNGFSRKMMKKRGNSGFFNQKRLGFLETELKKNEPFQADPFQAMMWNRIKEKRPKGRLLDAAFENNLLRIAFDRRDKLKAMVF